jgi:hypothetical protein
VSPGLGLGLLAGLVAALLFGLGAVAQARGVRGLSANAGHLGAFLVASVRDLWTWVASLSYLAGFVLHAVAIWLLPLYLAQATISLSLPVTAVAATLLQERLTARHGWAIAAVTLGLALLAAGSGAVGSVRVDPSFVGVVWLAVGLLVAVGVAHRHLGPGLLGAFAGVGYAASAVAVRGVRVPLEPLVVTAAVAVPVLGVLAFWIYSLALERGPVPAGSAPMIVLQTFVPAGVGLVWLGDGVRPGWEAAAAAGLVLATAGAVLLGREVRSPASAATGSSRDPAPRPGR